VIAIIARDCNVNFSAALLKSISDYRRHKARRGWLSALLRKYARLRHSILSILTGSDIDPNATLGVNLALPHPNGVVVHGDAVIGDDCMIMQQVTIGQLAEGPVPVIGASVYIGAGAKVLGKVVIGDRARIGANSVVLCDIPTDATAIGIPARILARTSCDLEKPLT
jgi:serine O-acetyltransferase